VLGIVANRVKRHPTLTERCWTLVAAELREKYDPLLGKVSKLDAAESVTGFSA